MEVIEFTDGLNVEIKEEESVKDNFWVSGLSQKMTPLTKRNKIWKDWVLGKEDEFNQDVVNLGARDLSDVEYRVKSYGKISALHIVIYLKLALFYHLN